MRLAGRTLEPAAVEEPRRHRGTQPAGEVVAALGSVQARPRQRPPRALQAGDVHAQVAHRVRAVVAEREPAVGGDQQVRSTSASVTPTPSTPTTWS